MTEVEIDIIIIELKGWYPFFCKLFEFFYTLTFDYWEQYINPFYEKKNLHWEFNKFVFFRFD